MPSTSHRDRADLDRIVKAYDVRGVYPDDLDESVAHDVGAAFVALVRGEGDGGPVTVVVGHDMRPSSGPLVAAFTAGATGQGADVVQVGLVSTDALYFASGHLSAPGAMFTASHNPAQYNGIKLCRAGRGTGRPGHRSGRDHADAARRRAAVRRAGGRRDRPRRAARVRGLPEEPGRPVRDPPAAGRRGRRQRHGRPHRARGPFGAAAHGRAAVLRAGRHLPEPRGEPDRPQEPARPAGGGSRGRRGPGAGVRRRRRPLLRRGRARRDRDAVHADRADRRARAGPRARQHGHPQPDHARVRWPRSCSRTAVRRCAPGSGTRSSSR